jgi:Glyoxalase-like domain
VTIARFKKVCLDSTDPARLGPFWASVLQRTWRPDGDEGGVFGPTPRHTVWINHVPEPKTVKNRVHLDIYAESLAGLEVLGSTVLRPAGDDRRWTVMADSGGGEYCAFLRVDPPADRLHGLVVDSADPFAQARWWAEIFGSDQVSNQHGFATVQNIPGMPIRTMDFVEVPEPKAVKNRVHWDVGVVDVQLLLDAGAEVLRPRGADLEWYVMADPEGNEFCAFLDQEKPTGQASS